MYAGRVVVVVVVWGGLDVGATQLIIDFLGTESSTFEAHTLILIPCMARSDHPPA